MTTITTTTTAILSCLIFLIFQTTKCRSFNYIIFLKKTEFYFDYTGSILGKLNNSILCMFGCNLKIKILKKSNTPLSMTCPLFPPRLKLLMVERMLNNPGILRIFCFHILIRASVHHSAFPCISNVCSLTGSIYFNASFKDCIAIQNGQQLKHSLKCNITISR